MEPDSDNPQLGPLHSDYYTISGVGYSNGQPIQGLEINNVRFDFFDEFILKNESDKCFPQKYYGEWTWYYDDTNSYFGNVYFAVGPNYQMKQITETPYGQITTDMYSEGREIHRPATVYPNYGSTTNNNQTSNTKNNNSSTTFNYESQYRRYERLAESHYNSLTTLGARYSNNGNISGTAGNRSNIGGNIVTLKMNLRDAQKNMRRIRMEAAQQGVTIPQSSWETATVQ